MKELWDLICYYSDGDDVYAEFEMVYYAVGYVNTKSKFKCEEQVENYCDVWNKINVYIYIYTCSIFTIFYK